LALVTYTQPYPGVGWVDEDPVTGTSPTPINQTALSNITNALAAFASAINNLDGRVGSSGIDLAALAALGVPGSVQETATPGTYLNRPAYAGPVYFEGTQPPPSGGTTAGGNGKMVAGLDKWFHKG